MSSGSYLSCCHGHEAVDHSETAATGLSRNLYNKYKNASSAHSPKSSLKNMLLARSFKKTETAQKLSNDRNPELSALQHKQLGGNSSFSSFRQPTLTILGLEQSGQKRREPQVRATLTRNEFRSRQPASFSFNDYRSPYKVHSIISSPISFQKNNPRTANKPQEQSSKAQNTSPTATVKREVQNFMQSKVQPRPAWNKNQSNPPGSRPKIALGGSKFTVLSEGEVEEAPSGRSIPIQQSDIIVNVFHPTKSQLQKWQKPTPPNP